MNWAVSGSRDYAPALCASGSHTWVASVGGPLGLKDDRDVTLFLEHHAHELDQFELVRSGRMRTSGIPRRNWIVPPWTGRPGAPSPRCWTASTGVDLQQSGPTISKPVIEGLSGNRVLLLNQGSGRRTSNGVRSTRRTSTRSARTGSPVVRGAASVQYGSDALGESSSRSRCSFRNRRGCGARSVPSAC